MERCPHLFPRLRKLINILRKVFRSKCQKTLLVWIISSVTRIIFLINNIVRNEEPSDYEFKELYVQIFVTSAFALLLTFLITLSKRRKLSITILCVCMSFMYFTYSFILLFDGRHLSEAMWARSVTLTIGTFSALDLASFWYQRVFVISPLVGLIFIVSFDLQTTTFLSFFVMLAPGILIMFVHLFEEGQDTRTFDNCQLILDSINDFILLVDQDGSIIFMNRQFKSLYQGFVQRDLTKKEILRAILINFIVETDESAGGMPSISSGAFKRIKLGDERRTTLWDRINVYLSRIPMRFSSFKTQQRKEKEILARFHCKTHARGIEPSKYYKAELRHVKSQKGDTFFVLRISPYTEAIIGMDSARSFNESRKNFGQSPSSQVKQLDYILEDSNKHNTIMELTGYLNFDNMGYENLCFTEIRNEYLRLVTIFDIMRVIILNSEEIEGRSSGSLRPILCFDQIEQPTHTDLRLLIKEVKRMINIKFKHFEFTWSLPDENFAITTIPIRLKQLIFNLVCEGANIGLKRALLTHQGLSEMNECIFSLEFKSSTPHLTIKEVDQRLEKIFPVCQYVNSLLNNSAYCPPLVFDVQQCIFQGFSFRVSADLKVTRGSQMKFYRSSAEDKENPVITPDFPKLTHHPLKVPEASSSIASSKISLMKNSIRSFFTYNERQKYLNGLDSFSRELQFNICNCDPFILILTQQAKNDNDFGISEGSEGSFQYATEFAYCKNASDIRETYLLHENRRCSSHCTVCKIILVDLSQDEKWAQAQVQELMDDPKMIAESYPHLIGIIKEENDVSLSKYEKWLDGMILSPLTKTVIQEILVL